MTTSPAAGVQQPEVHDPEVRQAERLAAAYLDLVDDLLPGRVEGFYVVGSAALGAFDADHSDVDFIAVLDRPLGRDEVRKLRVAHRRSAGVSVLRASQPQEVKDVVEAAASQAYNACTPTAVLLSQRLIGTKVFVK